MAAAFLAMEQKRLSSQTISKLDLMASLLEEQVPLTITENESGFKVEVDGKELNLKGNEIIALKME